MQVHAMPGLQYGVAARRLTISGAQCPGMAPIRRKSEVRLRRNTSHCDGSCAVRPAHLRQRMCRDAVSGEARHDCIARSRENLREGWSKQRFPVLRHGEFGGYSTASVRAIRYATRLCLSYRSSTKLRQTRKVLSRSQQSLKLKPLTWRST